MKNTLVLRLAAMASAAVALITLSSCSTAEVKDTWTAPDITKLSFKNVLVIAATGDGTNRRTFEDAVVAAVPHARAVPSYAFLADKVDVKDAAGVTAALKASNFDGVVTLRLISDRSQINVNQMGDIPWAIVPLAVIMEPMAWAAPP